MASRLNNEITVTFEDLFPSMVSRLGAEGFMEELCSCFRFLMDPNKSLITFESLKINSTGLLGLDFHNKSNGDLGNDDDGDEMIKEMLKEGDLDGDGCLNLMEFCVLMFRISPALMGASKMWLHQYTS